MFVKEDMFITSSDPTPLAHAILGFCFVRCSFWGKGRGERISHRVLDSRPGGEGRGTDLERLERDRLIAHFAPRRARDVLLDEHWLRVDGDAWTERAGTEGGERKVGRSVSSSSPIGLLPPSPSPSSSLPLSAPPPIPHVTHRSRT